jgi:hypothetical protein
MKDCQPIGVGDYSFKKREFCSPLAFQLELEKEYSRNKKSIRH